MTEDFSVRLSVAIARSGKFKGDLAAHCGVALSTVSRWLKGARPKPNAVAQIAEFLGVDPLWLLGEENDNVNPKLASAEREAGLSPPLEILTASAKTVDEVSEILRKSSASLAERLRAYPVGSYMWGMELESAAYEVGQNVESIANLALQMASLTTPGRLKEGERSDYDELRKLGKKAQWQAQKVLDMGEDFFPAILEVVDRIQREIARTAHDQEDQPSMKSS